MIWALARCIERGKLVGYLVFDDTTSEARTASLASVEANLGLIENFAYGIPNTDKYPIVTGGKFIESAAVAKRNRYNLGRERVAMFCTGVVDETYRIVFMPYGGSLEDLSYKVISQINLNRCIKEYGEQAIFNAERGEDGSLVFKGAISESVKAPSKVNGARAVFLARARALVGVSLGDDGTLNRIPAYETRSFEVPLGTYHIGERCFVGARGAIIAFPSTVRSVGEYAFSGCGLVEVRLNDGLREIKRCAFEDNSFAEVTLPESVDIVRGQAFRGCSKLKRVKLFRRTKVENMAFPRSVKFIYLG